MQASHIDVTVDFSHCGIGRTYDLRIPVQLSAKQLLLDMIDTLKLGSLPSSRSAIKVTTKDLILADGDMLIDYPVTNGDILVVLP